MAAAGPGPRTRRRRRQRSVRVTVAVSVLALATVLVLAALPTRSALWLGLASVTAMALSWAALRMMWTEVLQSRRENLADRAAAATAYRTLFTTRAAEHAEFTSAMTERLAEAHLSRRDLEGRLAQQQLRVEEAAAQRVAGERALGEAHQRVQELEVLLAVREAEDADALASWEPSAPSRTRRPRLVKEA
jgi:hypothetical protein